MRRWLSFAFILLQGANAFAGDKVRVDVSDLTNLTASGPCNITAWWGADLTENIKRQLEFSLAQNRGIDVVDAERLRAYRPARDSQVSTIPKSRLTKNSQFSVRPTLQKFNLCQVTLDNKTSIKAAVSIQIHILNSADGKTVDSFVAESSAEDMVSGDKLDMKGVSLGSGVFKDSPVGKAMLVALANATDGIAKRLPASSGHAPELNVQLIKKNTP